MAWSYYRAGLWTNQTRNGLSALDGRRVGGSAGAMGANLYHHQFKAFHSMVEYRATGYGEDADRIPGHRTGGNPIRAMTNKAFFCLLKGDVRALILSKTDVHPLNPRILKFNTVKEENGSNR